MSGSAAINFQAVEIEYVEYETGSRLARWVAICAEDEQDPIRVAIHVEGTTEHRKLAAQLRETADRLDAAAALLETPIGASG